MKTENVKSAKAKRTLVRGLIYVVCIILALTAFYPFFTMIISATHDSYNIVTKLNLLPGAYLMRNYQRLTQNINIWRGFANSTLLSTISVTVTLYFSALTAYAFSKFRFKGQNFLFGVIMVAMMLPGQIGIIGFFREISNFGLLDTYIPLIIPGIANCFCVFFFKQYLDGALPNEIIEAAYSDGCGELSIFHRIVMPIMVPALVTQGVMIFIGSWNSYMMPLIIIRSSEKQTLPLLIATVRDAMVADYGAQFVGMLISVIPLVIIFSLASRVIMDKISIGAAVKG